MGLVLLKSQPQMPRNLTFLENGVRILAEELTRVVGVGRREVKLEAGGLYTQAGEDKDAPKELLWTKTNKKVMDTY